jgi:hypothetical protein
MFIVNLTTESFVRCNKASKVQTILLQLLLKYGGDLDDENGYSHWTRDDKIVYCPEHLQEYVERKYGEIYL